MRGFTIQLLLYKATLTIQVSTLVFRGLLFAFLCIVPSLSSRANPPHYVALDPTLVNGKQYTFQLPNDVQGHQYLWSNVFFKGSVFSKGQQYDNQLLRYDIYNQQVTLKFVDQFGSEKIIILSDAWLNSFTLGEKKFEFITALGEQKKVFQTIGSENLRVLYFWKKQMKLDGTSGKSFYRFTEPQRECYIQIGEKVYPYKRNRGFASAFGKGKDQVIANHLRKNRIKVSRANDFQMEELVKYCNSIIQDL